MFKRALILVAATTALAWAGTKPIPIYRRHPVPLTPWEARRAVTLERDVIAEANQRVISGQGRLNDYIMLRFSLPQNCTDAQLSEARRVLLHEITERLRQ